MKQYILISVLISSFFWVSCSTTKHSISNDAHTSQNSLDWAGSYSGILPCADCEGILTKIELRQDKTYQLSQQYQGKDEAVKLSKGVFTWTKNGSEIILKDKAVPMRLKVGENKLFILDENGQRMTGSLKDKYILTK